MLFYIGTASCIEQDFDLQLHKFEKFLSKMLTLNALLVVPSRGKKRLLKYIRRQPSGVKKTNILHLLSKLDQLKRIQELNSWNYSAENACLRDYPLELVDAKLLGIRCFVDLQQESEKIPPNVLALHTWAEWYIDEGDKAMSKKSLYSARRADGNIDSSHKFSQLIARPLLRYVKKIVVIDRYFITRENHDEKMDFLCSLDILLQTRPGLSIQIISEQPNHLSNQDIDNLFERFKTKYSDAKFGLCLVRDDLHHDRFIITDQHFVIESTPGFDIISHKNVATLKGDSRWQLLRLSSVTETARYSHSITNENILRFDYKNYPVSYSKDFSPIGMKI